MDAAETSSGLRYSVVVPVFNEADNIAAFCRRALDELPPGYELLICYDMPEDTTIAALDQLPANQKPPNVRLVHNQLGRGVRYAIEAGFREATAPLILVLMVDLSDDLPQVGRMLDLAEQGAAVVCGSRYMKGGRQLGGPLLKSLMSRTAGLTLNWFTGLPTHDATNSFKVYRKDFLKTQTIESAAGFSLGLELTVKAHFQGLKVTEVPSTWYDRTAGESRFRLWKWLPLYLHWYLFAFRCRWRQISERFATSLHPKVRDKLAAIIGMSKDASDQPTTFESEAFTNLSTRMLAIVAAGLAAFLVMYGVYYFIPQPDTPDVIGMSLLRGYLDYSERAEANAFHSYILSAPIFGIVAWWIIQRLSDTLIRTLGFGVLWLLLAYFVGESVSVKILQTTIVFGILTGLGHLISRIKMDRDDFIFPGWILSVVAWGVVQERYCLTLGNPPYGFVAITIPCIIALALLRKYRPEHFSNFFPAIAVATVIVLAMNSGRNYWGFDRLVAMGALVFVNSDRTFELAKWFTRDRLSFWLRTAAVTYFVGSSFILPTSRQEYECLALEALICGLLLQMGRFQQWAFIPYENQLQELWTSSWRSLGKVRQIDWIMPILILAMAWSAGLYAVFMSALMAGIAWGERHVRPGVTRGILIASVLAIACWPHTPLSRESERDRFDVFHRGQILSAIWELEHGRKLITEVFPLRSAHVVAGLIARQFLGPTMKAVDFADSFGVPIAAAGACLIGYAWTRSPLWSVLCSLSMLSTLGHSGFEIRVALLLLMAGLSMELLGCRKSQCWWLLVPLSIIPFFAGYDVAIPYLGGVGVAIVLGRDRLTSFRTVCRSGVVGVAIVGTSALLFSLILVFLAGTNAAIDYWLLLIDYSRNLSAFFGLPVAQHVYADPWIQHCLIALASFAAAGAIAWKQMNLRRRRHWLFLLVMSTLFCHRGLGRSDGSHLHEASIPVFILCTLIIYEIQKQIAEQRLRLTPRRARLFVQIWIVLLIWRFPYPQSNIFSFFNEARHFPTQETFLLKPNPAIEAIVSPQQFLWPIEFAVANIEQERHNPTRHALAYCIASTTEQRRAVRDLERNDTPLILWNWTRYEDVEGPLRQWIISTDVLRKYEPGGKEIGDYPTPYLVRAEPDWKGTDDIPKGFVRSFKMYHLPHVWGERRWPKLSRRVMKTHDCGLWDVGEPIPNEPKRTSLIAHGEIVPRDWNYLHLEFTVENTKKTDTKWPVIDLQFSNDDTFSPNDEVTWECPPDGKRHRYLIPIGCFPSWTWKTQIRNFRLSAEAVIDHVSPISLCEIDEKRDHD